MRTALFPVQGFNALSHNNVLEEMHNFDKERDVRTVAKLFLRDREGGSESEVFKHMQ